MNAVEIKPESFKANRRFYDNKHYPKGLNRSGDYALTEVHILAQYGVALLELA